MYDRYRNIYDDKYLQDLILNITLEEVNERIDELIMNFQLCYRRIYIND